MKVNKDKVAFDSGRVEDISGCGGLIAINDKFELGVGADQDFPWGVEDLSDDESVELADYMIGLWKNYRKKFKGNLSNLKKAKHGR